MKCILRDYGQNMNFQQRQVARRSADDITRARGTARTPSAPRDIIVQSGPRCLLLNWRMPGGLNSDIAGFRIYKDDESNLFVELRDPNTRQHVVDATAGSSPPVTNVFISSINKLGEESPLVQVQGAALTEAGAPSFPGSPGTYGGGFGGGTGGGGTGGGGGQRK